VVIFIMDSNEVPVEEAEKTNDDQNDNNSGEEWSDAEEEESEINPDEWKLIEEEYVAIDLIGLIKSNVLEECDKNEIKLIGLFDDQPMMQIGKTFFIADREEVPGTNVVFQIEKRTDPVESDDDENSALTDKSPQHKIELNCLTRKKLVMRQCSLSALKRTSET